MLEDNTQTYSPSPFWKRIRIQDSTFLVFICTLVAVVLSWNLFADSIFRTAHTPSQGALTEDQGSNTSTTETHSRTKWKSNTINISFDIPDGWTEYEPPENLFTYMELHMGLSEPLAVFKSNTNTCIIAANRSHQGESTIQNKQTSFGDRVYDAAGEILSSSWYIASTTENAKYFFSWDRKNVRQYAPGEFRSTSSSGPQDNIHFVLFTTDGTAVPDQCNRDLNVLLESSGTYYEPVHLTQGSKGTMFLETVYSRGVYESLVFVPEGSNEKFEVARPPESGSGSNRFGNKVLGNKIYRPGNGGVYSYDPFKNEFSLVFEEINRILSLFIYRDNFYYTTATICPENWKDCPSSLYTVPVNGGIPALVATTTVGPHIEGYDEDERAWYIIGGYSDAGCGSLNISKVVGNYEQSVQRFDGCVDWQMEGDQVITIETPEKNEMEIARRVLKEKVSDSYATSTAIRVENGTLSPATANDVSKRIIYFAKP